MLILANVYGVCVADSVMQSVLPTSGDKFMPASTTECGSATIYESATYRSSSRCISLLRGAIRPKQEALFWTTGCSSRCTRKSSKSSSRPAFRPSATPSTDGALRTSTSNSKTRRSGRLYAPAARKCTSRMSTTLRAPSATTTRWSRTSSNRGLATRPPGKPCKLSAARCSTRATPTSATRA